MVGVMLKVLRRGSTRYLALTAVLLSILLCLYYANYNTSPGGNSTVVVTAVSERNDQQDEPRQQLPAAEQQQQQQQQQEQQVTEQKPAEVEMLEPDADSVISADTCPAIATASADVNTVDQFKKFEFQPYWMKSREYWDSNFEERYKVRKTKWPKLPLKVILVPHSHNDPGWVKTYESYYHYQTRNILNNMVDKLQNFKNMTFIWTEISFFSQWWESAHPTKRRVVKTLLDEGRLEITTGGGS
ncbi:hypothetical protein L9F63_026399 [Diploptera punctata]|uniref:Glycoside hydrolase family 38 N-terminal domain-containing protein n=1 Tax=Diploptera punctata TaxID=6984 RepID=A0AAD8ALB0_DIPPU|nr:hypothetical protein L9F63_026399 [Diploptera punctata]